MKNRFEFKNAIWISGLLWQVLPENEKNDFETIRRNAHLLGHDLYVIRKAHTSQIGYASTRDGYTAGQRSAAAVVSKSIEINYGSIDFLCAVQISENLYLYTEQAEGLITANGDMIADEVQVKEKLLTALALNREWSCIIAPVHWNIAQSKDVSLADLIPESLFVNTKKIAWHALQSIEKGIHKKLKVSKKTFAVLTSCLLLTSIVALGTKFYFKYHGQITPPPITSSIQITPPWHEEPAAQNATLACESQFNAIDKLYPGGWQPKSTTCAIADRTFTVQWIPSDSASKSSVFFIQEEIPQVNISRDFKSANLSKKINIAMNENQETLPGQDRLKQMVALSQIHDFSLDILESTGQTLSMANSPQSTKSDPHWFSFKWNVKTNRLSPKQITDLLNGPGLRVNFIKTNIVDGALDWEMEGTQYVAQTE